MNFHDNRYVSLLEPLVQSRLVRGRPSRRRSDNCLATSAGRLATVHSPSHCDRFRPSAVACFSNATHQSTGCIMFFRSLVTITLPPKPYTRFAVRLLFEMTNPSSEWYTQYVGCELGGDSDSKQTDLQRGNRKPLAPTS